MHQQQQQDAREPRPRKWLNTMPGDRRPVITLGLDLGQTRNHTAIAVLERRWVQATVEQFLYSSGAGHTGYWDHRVITLERLDLETSYLDIAHWTKDYLDRIAYPCHKHLVMDATGVGSAVRDTFRDLKLKANLVPVTITSSQLPGWRTSSMGGVTTSRAEILTKLLTSIEQELFAINKNCRHRDTLFHELVNLRMTGKPESTTSSSGQDDLAFALALAVWWGIR